MFKKIIKHSFIYSLGNLSTKLIGFILLPFYTSYLSTSEYGILALLEITGQILVSVFSFNLATGMMRWIAESKNAKIEKSINFTVTATTLIIAVLFSLLFIPFSNELSNLFFETSNYSNYFILLFLSSAFGIYNLVPLTLMRQYEKSTQFTIFTTIKFLITLLFIIYFITKLSLGVEGVLLGQLIGHVLLALVTIPFMLKNISFSFRFNVLKEISSYSFPLVFSGVFALLLTMSDRYFLKFFFNDSSVGIYSLGHKIASVINMFLLQSFQLGFLPIAYKKLNDEDAKPFFSRVLTIYVLVLVVFSLGLSMFSRELLELLAKNKEYWAAQIVIPFIALAFVLRGANYLFSLSFHYTKKTTKNAYIVATTAIFNFAICFVIIPQYDFIGAAISLVISYLFMTILTYHFGQKVYYVKYKLSKVLTIIIVGIIYFSISLLFDNYSTSFRIIIKIIIFISFCIHILFMNIISKDELIKLKKALTYRMKKV